METTRQPERLAAHVALQDGHQLGPRKLGNATGWQSGQQQRRAVLHELVLAAREAYKDAGARTHRTECGACVGKHRSRCLAENHDRPWRMWLGGHPLLAFVLVLLLVLVLVVVVLLIQCAILIPIVVIAATPDASYCVRVVGMQPTPDDTYKRVVLGRTQPKARGEHATSLGRHRPVLAAGARRRERSRRRSRRPRRGRASSDECYEEAARVVQVGHEAHATRQHAADGVGPLGGPGGGRPHRRAEAAAQALAHALALRLPKGVQPPHSVVEDCPRRQSRPPLQLGKEMCSRQQLQLAGTPLKQRDDDGLILERVEGARGVGHHAAGREQVCRAQRQLQLEGMELATKVGRPITPQLGRLADRAVARARNVAHDPVVAAPRRPVAAACADQRRQRLRPVCYDRKPRRR